MNLFSKGLLLIAIPCAFELFLLAVLFQGQEDAVVAEQWAAHSRDVIREGDGILVEILSEALRFRGDLLAETPSLASDSFWQGLDSRLGQLAAMVQDNPQQLGRVVQMRVTLVDYRNALAETFRQAVTGGPTALARRYRPGGGVVVLDRLRGEMSTFLDAEVVLDQQRTRDVFAARLRQRNLFVLVALGSLLAAGAGAYAFSRGIATRVATLTDNARRLVEGEPLLAPIGGEDEIARLDQALHESSGKLADAERIEEGYRADLQRRAEELAQLNADLQKQTEDNELFIYSVSHDLRSPLVNLQGFNRELGLAGKEIQEIIAGLDATDPALARIRELLDNDVVESLHYMDNAVQRAASIIDALLRLSRAGRVEYQPRAVDVAISVQRIVDALHGTLTSRRVRVVVHPLPVVWADVGALEQVFGNLVANAATYLDPTRPGIVEIGAKPAESDAQMEVIYVKDNGLGIPSAYLGKVFTAFQRLHTDVAPGEGIGLALARRVIERQGGQVWVESVEHEGTTFFVALPRPPSSPSGEGEGSERTAGTARPPGAPDE